MRRVFQGFKDRTIVRWLTAGKAPATHSYANYSDIGRNAARRIVETAISEGSSIDRRKLETDIRFLARTPAGAQQLEQALASSGEGKASLTVRALIYQVMADLACQADLVPRQVCVWSVFCSTALWAAAAVILVGAGLDLISRLIWLAGLAAALSSIGLAVTGLAALRRRNVLAEVELMRALAAACESFSDDPAGGSV